jgi:hypothetical protein
VELSTVASLFGGAASPSDSVSQGDGIATTLLGNSTTSNNGSTNSILQGIETAMADASSTVSTTEGRASSSASIPSTGSDKLGTLFNYMG